MLVLARPAAASPISPQALNRGPRARCSPKAPTADELFVARPQRVRAARAEGARREPRQVAEPLPLRARRAHRDRARASPPSATSTSSSASSSRRAASSPAPTPAASTSSRATIRSRSAAAPLQALAERLGDLRLARVHDAGQRALDRRRTSRSTRSRSTSPTSTTCPRARRSASIARSTRRSATAPRAMLCVPLISREDEVIGVIQLINKKRDPREAPLRARTTSRSRSSRSTSAARSSLGMLAAQAGISLENAMLYDEIRRIFEGFVQRERRGDRAARSDDERSLAPRRRSHRRARAGRSSASRRGPVPRRRVHAATTSASSSTRRCSTTSARSACASRCSSRRRSSTRTSSSSSAQRFDFVVRSLEVDVLAPQARARRARRAGARARGARRGARASGARELDDGVASRSTSANEPTVLEGRRLRSASRRSRARRTSTCAARCGRCSRADEVTSLSASRAARSRPREIDEIRSHVVAHLQLPLARSRGASSFRRVAASSPARTTSGSTAPAIRTASAPRRSRSSRR